MHRHDLHISFAQKDIMAWSDYCMDNYVQHPAVPVFYTTVESPETSVPVHIPEDYYNYLDVFSKDKPNGLPYYCLYNCTIDLMPGTTLPHCRIYPPPKRNSELILTPKNQRCEGPFMKFATFVLVTTTQGLRCGFKVRSSASRFCAQHKVSNTSIKFGRHVCLPKTKKM